MTDCSLSRILFMYCCHTMLRVIVWCNWLTFCRMVLKSIGYKSVPVDGLPFDHKKGE